MFGILAIHDDGRTLTGRDFGGPKPRGLLELLLLARGRTLTKDALADQLWGDGPQAPVDQFRTLEHYVCVLRRTMCPDRRRARSLLVTGTNSYRLDPGQVSIDLDQFDQLLLAAERSAPVERRRLLLSAVAIPRGDILADSPFPDWWEVTRSQYRDRVARAHLELATGFVNDEQFHIALHHCDEALRHAPYCERAFHLTMLCTYALGYDDMARSAYRRCQEMLARGPHVAPTADTVALAAAIEAGESIDSWLPRRPLVA